MNRTVIGAGFTILLAACSSSTDPHTGGDVTPALSTVKPDADKGRAVFVERDAGHCVLCHAVDGLDAPFQGNVGPALSGIGSRLTADQIRYRIVDASRLNPATVMPPYYRTDNLNRVAPARAGQPVLTAAEIDHLVAYLVSLK